LASFSQNKTATAGHVLTFYLLENMGNPRGVHYLSGGPPSTFPGKKVLKLQYVDTRYSPGDLSIYLLAFMHTGH